MTLRWVLLISASQHQEQEQRLIQDINMLRPILQSSGDQVFAMAGGATIPAALKRFRLSPPMVCLILISHRARDRQSIIDDIGRLWHLDVHDSAENLTAAFTSIECAKHTKNRPDALSY